MLEHTAETQRPTMLLGLALSVFLGEVLLQTQTMIQDNLRFLVEEGISVMKKGGRSLDLTMTMTKEEYSEYELSLLSKVKDTIHVQHLDYFFYRLQDLSVLRNQDMCLILS